MRIDLGAEITADDLDAAAAAGTQVILATGSRPVTRFDPALSVDALTVLSGAAGLPHGPVVVHDTVVGTLLSLTGDLADANVRLQRAGVTRELRSLLREVSGGTALLEDVWTGAQRRVDCAVLVDCGHRLPDETLYLARPGTPRAGDCVAPRTVAEAIREGRRLGQAAAQRRPADRTALIR